MQQEHNHGGDPTYIAYARMKCRHPDCYSPFREYQAKLAVRKLGGTFVDMRWNENRLPTMVIATAEPADPEAEILALPAPAEVAAAEAVEARETPDAAGAGNDPPVAQEPAEGQEEADQDVVLNRLKRCTTPGGMVFDQALDLDLMTYVTKLSEARINAAIKALVAAGKIRFDSEDHVWLTGKVAA